MEYSIPISVWFEQLLDPMKETFFKTLPTHRILYIEFGSILTTFWPNEKELFLKFFNRKTQEVPFEILTFLRGKLYQKFYFSYTLPTRWILHAEFGLIGTTPWSDEKDLFLKLAIRENLPYEKLTFFLDKL